MKSIDLPEMKLIRITWLDANFAPGWNNKNRMTASLPLVTTVGYVTYSDKKILELSSTIGDEWARLNPLSISWRSIIELKELNGY
jgi:hypothetical protein